MTKASLRTWSLLLGLPGFGRGKGDSSFLSICHSALRLAQLQGSCRLDYLVSGMLSSLLEQARVGRGLVFRVPRVFEAGLNARNSSEFPMIRVDTGE